MDALGRFLAGLPVPLGSIVTGLLPLVVIGGLAIGARGWRRRRVMSLASFAVACGVATAAFMGATG